MLILLTINFKNSFHSMAGSDFGSCLQSTLHNLLLSSNRTTQQIHVYITKSESTQTIIKQLESLKKGIFITKWSNLHSANSNYFHGEQTHTQTSPSIRQQTAQNGREIGVSAEAAERKHRAEDHTCRSLSLWDQPFHQSLSVTSPSPHGAPWVPFYKGKIH